MIHRNVEIVDLDPLTWRNLGKVLRIDELSAIHSVEHRTLSILHQAGTVLKVALPQGVNVQLDSTINDPQQFARQLYENAAHQVDCVQIFEKSSLARFSDAVQRLDWQKLTSGDFYLRAYELAQADTAGIVYYPSDQAPRWNVMFKHAQRLLSTVPDGQTLVLGIYDNGQPYFTLIVKVEQQQITLCTTFEYLQPFGIDPAVVPSTADDVLPIVRLVEQHIGKVAHSLFCDRMAFEAWRDGLGVPIPIY
jgi:hypothetical protein